MKKFGILVILMLSLIFSNYIFAKDKSTNVSGKIGIGFSGYGSSDYKGKVAEYQTSDSNVNFKLKLKGMDNSSNSDFNFIGNFISSDESNFSGWMNVERYFKISGSYSKFLHRLDHDELFRHYIKKPTNLKDYPYTIQKDINGDGKPETLQGFPVVAVAPLKAPTKPGSKITWYDLIKKQYFAKKMNKGWKFDDKDKTITINGLKTNFAVLHTLYPYYDDVVAFEEHGPKAIRFTDHNVGENYYIERELTKTNFNFALPFFPQISIIGKYRNEKRWGYRQAMGMSAHCATCHVQSMTKHIDQEDTAYTVGFEYNHPNVNFSYTHTWEHFSRSDSHLRYFYELTHRPPVDDPYYGGYGFPKNQDFANRVRYEGEMKEFARTPKTSKNIDEAKLRITLYKNTDFYTSFTSIRASDTDRTEVLNKDLDSDYTGVLGRISSNISRKLNLTLAYRYYNIDTDDIYVPDSKAYSGRPAGWGTEAYKDSNVDFGYKRKSVADRDVNEIDFGLSYFLNQMFSFKGKISYKQIDRQNPLQVFENPTFNATTGNPGKVQLDEYDYGDTDITEFKFATYFYPYTKLHGMFSFRYTNINNPFENPHAKGEKNKLLDSVLTPLIPGAEVNVTGGVPTLIGFAIGHAAADKQMNLRAKQVTMNGKKMLLVTADGPIPIITLGMADGSTYLEFFRPFNRIENGTASPSDVYNVKFNFDWNVTDKFSVSPNIIYTHEDSDDTPWERKTWNAGINLSLMLNSKFNAYLSYDYINQKTTTDVYYSFFNGWAGTAFSPQVGCGKDDIDDTLTNHNITLGLNFNPTNRLNLFANFTYTKSKQGFDNINIPNKIKELQQMGAQAGPNWVAQNYVWGAVIPDFSNVDDWTDLEMSQIQLNVGGSYGITDKISLLTSFTYQDYNDEEYYIEDDDGSYYAVNVAIEYKF